VQPVSVDKSSLPINPMTYKVLTRSPFSKYPFRTHSEYLTMREAMAVAARLENNTELEVLVELPNNELQWVPLSLRELTA